MKKVFLCALIALFFMACTEKNEPVELVETTPMLLSDFNPTLKIDPEHPYSCVVQLWTSEILECLGIKTKEEAWNMSNEEKFALINQMNEEFADKSEDEQLNIELEYLYEHMTAIIHNYPGMDFNDGNDGEMMLDGDDHDVSCKLQAMYYKEFGRPFNGLDDSDFDFTPSSSTDGNAPIYKSAQYKLQTKWSKNTVRYRCSKPLTTSKHYTKMKDAMNIWRKASKDKITFKEIPNSGWNKTTWALGLNYHSFVDAKTGKDYAGMSTLGMVPWAILYFNSTANNSRTYLHELGHTLGLIHEHQRPDRDNYITVITSNIPNGWKDQYRKYLSSSVNLFGTFDFSSIMLYGSIQNNKVVMHKKDGSSIWSAPNELSSRDIEGIRQIYK